VARSAGDEGLRRFSLLKSVPQSGDSVNPLEIRVHADVRH
jgi:hypothetical protein